MAPPADRASSFNWESTDGGLNGNSYVYYKNMPSRRRTRFSSFTEIVLQITITSLDVLIN